MNWKPGQHGQLKKGSESGSKREGLSASSTGRCKAEHPGAEKKESTEYKEEPERGKRIEDAKETGWGWRGGGGFGLELLAVGLQGTV